MSLLTITGANQFKLGDPLVYVSFGSATRSTKIVKAHLEQLRNGLADLKAFEDWSSGDLNTAQKALLATAKKHVAYSEIKGLRMALRKFCDDLRPIFRENRQSSATFQSCLLEILLVLRGLNERTDIDDEESDWDDAVEIPKDRLQKLLTELSGPNMPIDDGWSMDNTSTEQNRKLLKKLREAKKKVGRATRKKILCTLLEYGQETLLQHWLRQQGCGTA